jgi:Flp pilus assembly protein TadD
MILRRNGRNDDARNALSRALKIQPDFQPAVVLKEWMPDKE